MMKMTRWLLLGFLATPGLAWAQDGKSAEDDKTKDQDWDKPAAKASDSESAAKRLSGAMERNVQAAQRRMQLAQQEMERAIKQQAESAKRAEASMKERWAAEIPAVGLRKYTVTRMPNGSSRFLNVYGFDLAEADPVLRSQLKLPADQGLVITRVAEKGLAEQAGLKVNDLILQLDDKDAGKPEQAREVLTKAGTTAVQIKLIRAGEPRQLSLVGPEHGTPTPAPTYWIGVNVAPVDATLRSHLTFLPADAGLIATEVVADSPAAKAGVQKADILAKIDEKPLTNQEVMVALIQKSEGKPVTIELFRAGKPQTLTATPEKRRPTRTIEISGDSMPKGLHWDSGHLTLTAPWSEMILPDRTATTPGQMSIQLKNLAAMENLARANGQVVRPDGPTAEGNTKLEKEVKDLSGKINELEKLIRELAKSKPAGKETKD